MNTLRALVVAGLLMLNFLTHGMSHTCYTSGPWDGVLMNAISDPHGFKEAHHWLRKEWSAFYSTKTLTDLLGHAYNTYHKDTLKIIKLLLARGADVNATQDRENNTLLHLACLGTYSKLLKLLLKQPTIHVDARNKHNQTPLMLVLKRDNDTPQDLVYMAKLLLDHGAQVNLHSGNHRTPLIESIYTKSALSSWAQALYPQRTCLEKAVLLFLKREIDLTATVMGKNSLELIGVCCYDTASTLNRGIFPPYASWDEMQLTLVHKKYLMTLKRIGLMVCAYSKSRRMLIKILLGHPPAPLPPELATLICDYVYGPGEQIKQLMTMLDNPFLHTVEQELARSNPAERCTIS